VAVFWYVLGILTGLALGLWRQRHWHRQKRQMLDMLAAPSWLEALKQVDELMRLQPRQQRQLRSLGTDLEKWERILQLAPIGYLQVDVENQLIWCNDEANQLLKMNQPLAGAVQRRRLLLEVARSYELDALIEAARQRQTATQREWMVYGISTDPLYPKEEPTILCGAMPFPWSRARSGCFSSIARRRLAWCYSAIAGPLTWPMS
jgi:two-component system phosphate regulon sensor histidine kinase PhoR